MKRILAALAVFGLSAAASPASADEVSAVWSVRAKGITAGEFKLNLATDGGKYSATAQRRMTGMVRSMVGDKQDYSYSANGLIKDDGLKPIAYQHQGGKRKRLVKVDFTANDVITTATPSMGMGTPPATKAQKLGSLDFLSSFVAMIVPPESADPCKRTLKVFDGRARFDLVMTPNGTQDVSIAGYKGKALRCTVAYKPIAGFGDPQEPATLTFLFAPEQNGFYRPLRIEMPTDDVGVVTLEAKSFTITPRA